MKDYRFADFTKGQFLETENGLVAEASDLELPVGTFPFMITVDGTQYYRGKVDYCSCGEDVAGVNYRSREGQNLLIIND